MEWNYILAAAIAFSLLLLIWSNNGGLNKFVRLILLVMSVFGWVLIGINYVQLAT